MKIFELFNKQRNALEDIVKRVNKELKIKVNGEYVDGVILQNGDTIERDENADVILIKYDTGDITVLEKNTIVDGEIFITEDFDIITIKNRKMKVENGIVVPSEEYEEVYIVDEIPRDHRGLNLDKVKIKVEVNGELIALLEEFKQESEKAINKLDNVKMKLDEINAIIRAGAKDDE